MFRLALHVTNVDEDIKMVENSDDLVNVFLRQMGKLKQRTNKTNLVELFFVFKKKMPDES
jgi:hypothetical protein